jgi:hypothetical protein
MSVLVNDIAIYNDRCLCIVKNVSDDRYELVNLFDTPRNDGAVTLSGRSFYVTEINEPDCSAFTFGNIGLSQFLNFDAALKKMQDHFANVLMGAYSSNELPIDIGAIVINNDGIVGRIKKTMQRNPEISISMQGVVVEPNILIQAGKVKAIEKNSEWVGVDLDSSVIFYPSKNPYDDSHCYHAVMTVLRNIKKETLIRLT